MHEGNTVCVEGGIAHDKDTPHHSGISRGGGQSDVDARSPDPHDAENVNLGNPKTTPLWEVLWLKLWEFWVVARSLAPRAVVWSCSTTNTGFDVVSDVVLVTYGSCQRHISIGSYAGWLVKDVREFDGCLFDYLSWGLSRDQCKYNIHAIKGS